MMRTYYEKVFNKMRRPVLLVAVAIVALVLASGVAVPVTSSESGGPIEAVGVARSSDTFSTTSSVSVDIPGASVRITVPPGERGLLLAEYSAESRCDGGNGCSVALTVRKDGATQAQQMQPPAVQGSFPDFVFDGPGDTGESHSVGRSLSVESGTYTVKARAAVINGSKFTVDDWSLTVLRAPQSTID
jgi:hypothetical protein